MGKLPILLQTPSESERINQLPSPPRKKKYVKKPGGTQVNSLKTRPVLETKFGIGPKNNENKQNS